MSVMPYQWLLRHTKELGYKEENIGPASVDLELGEVKVYSKFKREFILIDRVSYFYANEFYLCSTLEYIKVPPTHCALVNMRSSLARKGLGHKMAGFIDPGFEGQITLELESSTDVEVKKGDRIVQLIYMRLSEETEKPYTGKYSKQVGATLCYA